MTGASGRLPWADDEASPADSNLLPCALEDNTRICGRSRHAATVSGSAICTWARPGSRVRLGVANTKTAIEFWLDEDEPAQAGGRQLGARAVAFQHEGSTHLLVTLEDRRTD